MIYRGADARRVMAGDCFLHIIRFLHVEYDDEPETCDDPRCFKCSKIRNIFDILNNKICEMYNPTKHLAVDKVLTLYEGRVIFQQ
jgi:hypothetical protein